MGDAVICTLISLLWIPPALIALLLAAYIYISWKREDDLLKKDRKRKQIKYPALLFAAAILAIPVLALLTGSGLMEPFCGETPWEETPSACHTIKEFSDGSSAQTIQFPEYGSFNSETKITLPRAASVKNVSLTLKHDPEAEWKYEFDMWEGIASSSGIDLDTLKGCAYIKMKKLDVDSKVVLDGTQSFDEVHVKKGGIITTSPGLNLHLRIKGALTIDEGGMINLDGKSSQGTGKSSAKKEVGNFYGSGGGGGGHGGAGGKGGDDKPEVGGNGGEPYGLSENPIATGTSGANGGGCTGTSGSGVPGAGGTGGGALKIEAQEALINGHITANGLPGTDGTGNEGTGGGGGGSGGSIIISADSIIIKGEIKANGGTGGAGGGSDGSGGGGGGGRILVEYKTISGESRIEANGGISGTAPADKKGTDGGRGTIVHNTKKESTVSALIESSLTSKTIKPDNLRNWKTFHAKATVPSGSEIRYLILNASDNSSLCSIKQGEVEKGFDIESCASNTAEIALIAEFTTISVAKTPRLCEWSLEYETEVKNLAIDAGIDHIPEYSAEDLYRNLTVSDANTEPKISAEFSRLAKECSCNGCIPSGNDCTITIEISGESSGSFSVEEPEIAYCT